MLNPKFKGKALANGAWVFGGYAEKAIQADSMIADVAIVPEGCFAVAVDPETVCVKICQDSEGSDLYSDDIINDPDNDQKYVVGFSLDLGPSLICVEDAGELGFDEVDNIEEWAIVLGNRHD